MERGQRLRHVEPDPQGHLRRQRAVEENVNEAAAGDEIHHNVGPALEVPEVVDACCHNRLPVSRPGGRSRDWVTGWFVRLALSGAVLAQSP